MVLIKSNQNGAGVTDVKIDIIDQSKKKIGRLDFTSYSGLSVPLFCACVTENHARIICYLLISKVCSVCQI